MSPLIFTVTMVFGLAVGSFLNVVIYRLPRGQSIVRTRSYCPQCRKKIPWYENVPLMSFLILRGKCSGCGARIPLRYPVVETMGGVLALFSLYKFGFNIDAVFAYAFLMALLAVTLIDWKHRIIPDEISLLFILVGLTWSFFRPALNPLDAALGALVGGGGLYAVAAVYKLLRRTEGMGGGDVKLMAMIGAFLGLKLVLPVVVIASFVGSIYGITLLKAGKGGKTTVAFGSFLAPAAAFCLFFGARLLAWYVGQF